MSNFNLFPASIIIMVLIPFISFCHQSAADESPCAGICFKNEWKVKKYTAIPLSFSFMSIAKSPIPQDKSLYNTSRVRPMIHYGMGGGDYSFTALGISVFSQINPSVMIGISTHYFGENDKSSFIASWQKIPVALEANIDIKKYNNNKSSLFARIGAGYSFTLNGSYYDPNEYINKKITNGWTIQTGVGYRFNIFQNTGLNFDMTYHLTVDKTKDGEGIVLYNNYWNHVLFRTSIFF